MVWICAEERQWIYWMEGVELGAVRQQEKRKKTFIDVVKEQKQKAGVIEPP